MSISHLKHSPNLLFLGLLFFFKQLHRGYGIWVGKEKYFYFLSLTLSGIDKNIKVLWVLVFLGGCGGEHALYEKDLELCLFSFSCLSAEKRAAEESYHQGWETKKTLREADSQSGHSVCTLQPLPRPWCLLMHSLKTKLFRLNSQGSISPPLYLTTI